MEMINNVVNFPQLPDPGASKPAQETPAPAVTPLTGGSTQSPSSAQTAQGVSQPAVTPTIAQRDEQSGKPVESDLRLTIDKDPQTGHWVYKAIDRMTGKVVNELPQQSVAEMLKSETYQAGSVINTEV